jgi:Tfp pilus assembly protein PilP
VADPAGHSFVLKEGSAIGKNRGRVIRIEDDLILVEEKFVDFEGTVTTKDVEMRIAKSQGG